MPPLYVVHQNAKLRVRNRRLEVERETENERAEVLASVPLAQVSQVTLFGNIGLTTPAIDALLDQGCEVTFLTQQGDFRGRLIGTLTPHVPIRKAQYRGMDSPEFALGMAHGFVCAKLTHQRVLLLRHNRETPDEEIRQAADQIAAALDSLPRKANLHSLRGLEGSATAAYFRGFRRFFGPEWNFTDRNRRPPADPVNVLLSLGYTILAQIAAAAAQAAGLDPFAGFLHETAYNRPAMGLDLMEEFRPVVDGAVLWCCRGGQITPQDFTPGPPDRPVILSEQGMKRFLAALEQRLDMRYRHPIREEQLTIRQCIFEQARQAAARVQSGQPGWKGMGFH